MHLSFEKLILQTQDVGKLAHFISHLFDIGPEVDSFGETFFVLGGVKLSLVNADNLQSNTCLSFVVDDYSVLENFKMKLEFYYYREAIENSCLVLESSLSFKDPDNREWILELPQQSSQIQI